MHYGPYLELYLKPWCTYSRRRGRIAGVPNPEGPNGQDSTLVLEYIRRCISHSQHWDVAVVNCGLHDIRDRRQGTLQTGRADYVRNLKEICRLLPGICDRFVWVRTTPVDDERHNSMKQDYWRHDADVVRYNMEADTVFASCGADIIDLYTFSRAVGLEGAFLDHIHFTPEMRQLQAAFVAGQLVALLHLVAPGELTR